VTAKLYNPENAYRASTKRKKEMRKSILASYVMLYPDSSTILTINDKVLPGEKEDQGPPYPLFLDIWCGGGWPFKIRRSSIVVGGHVFKNVLNVLGSHLVPVPYLAAVLTSE
jgi:hypothetical protein